LGVGFFRTAELSDNLQGGLQILAKALEATMKQQQQHSAGDGAAFFPYGLEREPLPDEAARLLPGAAEVISGDGRRGVEVYALARDAGHWQLYSQAFDAPWRLLARAPRARLPEEPMDAATELLVDLWSLRHAGRLRFVRGLELGALGRLRWRDIETRIPQPEPLESALRAEGHEVRETRGPVGTTEHLLVLRPRPA
jgi:hypothetical protein